MDKQTVIVMTKYGRRDILIDDKDVYQHILNNLNADDTFTRIGDVLLRTDDIVFVTLKDG